MADAIYLQVLILFSCCITAKLAACSPFGLQLIPEYGFRVVQPKGEPLPSLGPLPSTPILVCYMTFLHRILVFKGILALTPFWETQGTYWLSSQLTATGNLKYSYPEFNGLDLGNPNAVGNAI